MIFLIQKRLVMLFYLFGIIWILLLVNLWSIQIKDGEKYAVMVLNQGSSSVALEEFSRGRILDRNLLSLNGGLEEERIIVFPALLEKETVSRELAEIIAVPQDTVRDLLNGAPRYLPYGLTLSQIEAVKKHNWEGVAVLPVRFRYGDNPLAAQVTGHLGKIDSEAELAKLIEQSNKNYNYGDAVGKIGLEKMYEAELKGERPLHAVRVYHDANGNVLNGTIFSVEENGDSGRCDVILTLDARIQQIAEHALDSRDYKGAVVVMEAGTGELLAMASRPSFHPARVGEYLETGAEERFFDHCTALYQPGSIFKIVLAVAAMEENSVDINRLFSCVGEEDPLISCWHADGHDQIAFSDAFAQSCNPAFAKLGLSLGAQKIIAYAEKLGLDNQSVGGYLLATDSRQDLNLIAEPYNLVNSSIGQGPVLVTPVQVTAMVNTLVSDGVYREPHLVKEIRGNNQEIETLFVPDSGRRVVRSETAADLRRLMELATDEGVARTSLVSVFGSAGKTGSAQTGDSKQSVNAWFSGYAPRDNPRYIITVLIEEGISGSESAAPVFKDIMEQILDLE